MFYIYIPVKKALLRHYQGSPPSPPHVHPDTEESNESVCDILK